MNLKSILLILGLFGLAVVLAFIFSTTVLKNNQFFKATPTVSVNNQSIKVTVAESTEDKQIGLSKFSSLPKDEGMLFPFERPGRYPFWMKEMKFPIDIIYLNKNKVVTVFENVEPPKNKNENPPIYQPTEQADNVLEINAGLSKEYGIKKGTEVKYENISN